MIHAHLVLAAAMYSATQQKLAPETITLWKNLPADQQALWGAAGSFARSFVSSGDCSRIAPKQLATAIEKHSPGLTTHYLDAAVAILHVLPVICDDVN